MPSNEREVVKLRETIDKALCNVKDEDIERLFKCLDFNPKMLLGLMSDWITEKRPVLSEYLDRDYERMTLTFGFDEENK